MSSQWKPQELWILSFLRDPITKRINWDTATKDVPKRLTTYGGIAVYLGPNTLSSEDRWIVCILGPGNHGRREVKEGEWDVVACVLSTEEEAHKVGQALWDRCSSLIRLGDVQGMSPSDTQATAGIRIVEALPTWARAWLKRCIASGKYEDP